MAGGPLGDRFGRKYVIWFSILGMLPFTLMLPYANLFWTSILSVIIGMILASAFPAIVVYAQELLPGRVGMISGMFFGFSFGMGGIGAAVLGWLADQTSITFVYRVCAFLPAIGLLTVFLPDIGGHKHIPLPVLDPDRDRSRCGAEICGRGFARDAGADRSRRSRRSHRAPVPARHGGTDGDAGRTGRPHRRRRRMRRSRASCIAIPTGCCSRRSRPVRSIAASVFAARWSGPARPTRLSPADLDGGAGLYRRRIPKSGK